MQYILTEEEYDKLSTERLIKHEDKETVSSLGTELEQFIRNTEIQINPDAMTGDTILSFKVKEYDIPTNLYNFIKGIKGVL